MSEGIYEVHKLYNAQTPVWGHTRIYSIDDTVHWHENIEIHYVFEGTADMLCGSEVIKLSPGDVCVVSSKMLHAMRCQNSPCKCSYFILSEKFCGELGFFTKDTVFQKRIKDDRLSKLFELIDKEQRESGAYADAAVKIHLLEVLLLLYRHYVSRMSEHEASTRVKLTKSIISYIREHYSDNVNMDVLEKHCTYSKYYISRVFKDVTGNSVMGYLNEVRIFGAKHLLERTEDSISEIAQSVGFESQSYFGKVFKKHIGITPVQYRELARKRDV